MEKSVISTKAVCFLNRKYQERKKSEKEIYKQEASRQEKKYKTRK